MTLRDAFVNVRAGAYPSHLWFVVSNPTGANRVVTVNVSTDDGGLGDLPFLTPSDHPWLRHNSFIRTDFAVLALVPKLQELLATGRATRKNPATIPVLRKLQQALRSSRHTKREVKLVLEEQGFI